MFRITQGSGFHMEFENGWTVSVQFGGGNYCDNRYRPEDLKALFNKDVENLPEVTSSTNAEIAAWDADGNWYDFGDDTVKGWVEPDEVLEFMNMIAAKPAVEN